MARSNAVGKVIGRAEFRLAQENTQLARQRDAALYVLEANQRASGHYGSAYRELCELNAAMIKHFDKHGNVDAGYVNAIRAAIYGE